MAGQTRLEVRIPKEVKQRLEEIARVHGVSMTDLVMEGINIVLIREYIKQYETLEMLERAIVRSIVEKPEFQELLRELKKYVYYVDECYEWGCEKSVALDVIARMNGYIYATLLEKEKEGIIVPAVWIEEGYDNEYGSKHYYSWHKREVETLKELAEWLECVRDEFESMILNRLEAIREGLERLASL